MRSTLTCTLRAPSWLRMQLLLALGCASCRISDTSSFEPAGNQRRTEARDAAAPINCGPTRSTQATSATHDAGADANVTERALPQTMLMTWNLDWFQDPNEGPSDDAAQYAAVRAILAQQRPGVLALEELASEAAFERLLAELPGYAGVLSGYAWTQRTALLWQSERFTLLRARAISGLDDAGRPPLEVVLRDAASAAVTRVIVIHAKAQEDASSYARREALARGLHEQLRDAPRALSTVVLGDFNDLLIGSIRANEPSPYQVFLSDPDYVAPTRSLSSASSSEASYATGSTIDHILLSRDLGEHVVRASVRVLRAELEAQYPRFTSQVSDHFPVTLRLDR